MDPLAIRFYLRMLGYGLAIAAALFLGSRVYGWIFDRGAESVQILWDKETSEYSAEFVVRELRELVGLRDQQILALSEQIRNDRTLIEEETP